MTPHRTKILRTHEIQAFVNITTKELTNLQYERGLEYLAHYFPGTEATKANLRQTASFWTWWRQVWSMLDHRLYDQYCWYYHELIMQDNIDPISGKITYDLYERYHHPAISWYPNQAIQELAKQEAN
jgi:hypothetical protein